MNKLQFDTNAAAHSGDAYQAPLPDEGPQKATNFGKLRSAAGLNKPQQTRFYSLVLDAEAAGCSRFLARHGDGLNALFK